MKRKQSNLRKSKKNNENAKKKIKQDTKGE